MNGHHHITVLGAGPAGLAVGYYAKTNDLSFTMYEASNRVGGLSSTLEYKSFFFDSGAHRFHDKNFQATSLVKKILGGNLEKITISSCIYHEGRMLNFPFSPLNLIKNIGFFSFLKAFVEICSIRFKKYDNSFKGFAFKHYGKTFAKIFLLNYSHKLWGVPCSQLSCDVHGERLHGLNIKNILLKNNSSVKHIEGSFYYPRNGIGQICEKMKDFCGVENILIDSEVTKVLHNNKRIEGIEINNKKIVKVDSVISTLPLNVILKIMSPKVPKEIFSLIASLDFRSLIVVFLVINKDSVTKHGSVYFPSLEFPFVRICEPKNRSDAMSIKGKTSLAIEITCWKDDLLWGSEDSVLIDRVCSNLIKIGWLKRDEIDGSKVVRFQNAYPVLKLNNNSIVEKLSVFLNSFSNLKFLGRNARFSYSWIHDQLRWGQEIIGESMEDIDRAELQ